MKTSWKENKTLGIVSIVLAVLVGVYGVGGAKLNSRAAAAQTLFADTLQTDLHLRLAAAENIVAASTNSAGSPALAEAEAAVSAMQRAATPAQYYFTNVQLTSKIEALYELEQSATTVTVGSALQTMLSEFRSRGNILDNETETYNKTARALQKDLRGFPANTIAALLGISVEPFAS